MKEEDIKFIAEILEESPLLFYGEFEVYLDKFLREVFKHDFREYGFNEIKMKYDFATAYWFLLSFLESMDLFEYGTSPRGGWLTKKGERFKRIVMENKNALQEAQEYNYRNRI